MGVSLSVKHLLMWIFRFYFKCGNFKYLPLMLIDSKRIRANYRKTLKWWCNFRHIRRPITCIGRISFSICFIFQMGHIRETSLAFFASRNDEKALFNSGDPKSLFVPIQKALTEIQVRSIFYFDVAPFLFLNWSLALKWSSSCWFSQVSPCQYFRRPSTIFKSRPTHSSMCGCATGAATFSLK